MRSRERVRGELKRRVKKVTLVRVVERVYLFSRHLPWKKNGDGEDQSLREIFSRK
jgi:hypothetical protein